MYATALKWTVLHVSLSIFLAAEFGGARMDQSSNAVPGFQEPDEFNITLKDMVVEFQLTYDKDNLCRVWQDIQDRKAVMDDYLNETIGSYCNCNSNLSCSNSSSDILSENVLAVLRELLEPLCEGGSGCDCDNNQTNESNCDCISVLGYPLWLVVAVGSGICMCVVLTISVCVCCMSCCCTAKRYRRKENKSSKSVDDSDSWGSVEDMEMEAPSSDKPVTETDRIRNVYVPDSVPTGPAVTETAPPVRKPQHVPLDIHAAKSRAEPEAYEEAKLWRQDVRSASLYALNVEDLDPCYDDVHSALTDMRDLRRSREMLEGGHNYASLRSTMQEPTSKYAIPQDFKRRKGQKSKRTYYNIASPLMLPGIQHSAGGGRPVLPAQ